MKQIWKFIFLFKLFLIYFFIEVSSKTRYGANPTFQNTFGVIQAPENAATYISEKDRFDIRRKSGVDFLQKEKDKKKLIDLHRIEKLKEVNSRISHNAHMKEYLYEKKNVFSQLQRTMKLYKYENVKILFIFNIIYLFILD